jgi:AraC-like DNA-binding protein
MHRYDWLMDIIDLVRICAKVRAMPESPHKLPVFISKQIRRHRHFFANLTASMKMPGIAVACGGWEQSAPDYMMERKGFRFCSVEFVVRGKGRLHIFGHEHELRPGSLFGYGPGVAHRICSDATEPLEKYFVACGGRGALERLSELREAGAVQVSNTEVIRGYFDQLLEAGARMSDGAGDEAPMLARVMALLAELIVRHALASPERAQAGKVGVSRAGYERCVALLRENFLGLSSAEELARLAHVDAAYMSRLFQRHGAESPYRMLVRLKMNHAAEQLVTRARTLKEVGAEAGFPDPYHFSRVFKRVHGLPPGRFREGYHRVAK